MRTAASYTAAMQVAPSPAVPADTGLRIALPLLGWLAGTALQLQQPQLGSARGYVLTLGAAALLAAIGVLLQRRRRAAESPGARSAVVAITLAAALAAFAATGLRAGGRLADRLPAALEGQELVLTGVVAGLPQPDPQGVRFDFEPEQATLAGAVVRVPIRVSLYWGRGHDADELLLAPPPPISAGQRWRLPVRLKQPHGLRNPGGFDLELWLFERRIGATGSVRSGSGAAGAAQLLAAAVAHPVDRLRQRLRDAILLRVPQAGAAGVLAALAVGDQGAVDAADWALFRATGIAHLMSISGLHITMFAWLAGGAAGFAWRRSPRLALRWPAPLVARWCGVAAAGAYALLAGWGVPAQRTVLMLAVVAALRVGALRWPSLLVLLAAAFGVTLVDPWALLQPGFWLSFAAVAMLLVAAPQRAGEGRGLVPALRGALRTQAVASAGLTPLTLILFQQVAVLGFVANLIAIPLVTLLITPLALLGVGWPALWTPAAWLVDALLAALGWLAAWPWAVWSPPAAPVWAAAAALLGAALLLLPLPPRLRWLGLPLLLPLLLPPTERPPSGSFDLVVPDVGQGAAVLLRTRAHLLLYDAGPRYGLQADAGQRVLLPLLRARGENRIDLLVLSHRDTDHVGGAGSLLQGLDVRALLSSLEPQHPLRREPPPHRRCAAGQRWQWDGVAFEILHPPAGGDGAALSANARSCVLRVVAADGRSLVLTGDLDAAQEAALVRRAGAGLRAQLLLVPHHGSRSSSSAAFIAAVAPGTALVQAGYRNRFGHPAPEIQARYRDLGVELLRSDRCGAFSWPARGASRCEREVGRRYWHHQPALDTGPLP